MKRCRPSMSLPAPARPSGAPAQSWLLLPFLGLLRGYRWFISPLLGNRCRFFPSCSVYSEQALRTHGLPRGLLLTAQRLCRCHPFHPGGMDPVPPPRRTRPPRTTSV